MLRLLSPALLSLALVGCAPEERAARILNAFVTKVQLNADGSLTTFVTPDEVTCGDKKYLIEDGSFNATGGDTAPVDNKYLVTIDVDLMLTKASGEFPAEMLTCKFSARWGFDFDLYQYRGGGVLDSCDNFSCKLGQLNLDCNKMKAALAQFACN